MPGLLYAIAPYAAGIAGLAFAAYFQRRKKRMQGEFEGLWTKRMQALNSEMGKLRGMVQELKTRLEESERRAELTHPPPGKAPGLNLNLRSQAMRLFRRGDQPDRVAAALGVPQGEAELLMKIHRILTTPAPTERVIYDEASRPHSDSASAV